MWLQYMGAIAPHQDFCGGKCPPGSAAYVIGNRCAFVNHRLVMGQATENYLFTH